MNMQVQNHILVGVHIHNRLEQAVDVQRLLTEYGAHIKTRLGLHETQPEGVAGNGLLVLETVGDPAAIEGLIAKLNALDGVEADKMVFAH